MESEEVLMMFGKAADFNRDMYQVNIASMDVLMQLLIIDALDYMSDDGGGSQGDVMIVKDTAAETEVLAGELAKKLKILVEQIDRMNARYGAYLE
jgi:hypothetical protein